MTRATTDDELIARAVCGDADALGDLYRRYDGAVRRFIASRWHDPFDVDDICGDVWLRVCQTMPRYHNRDTPIVAWLFTIAHGKMVDRLRRHEPRGVLDDVIVAVDLPDVDDPYDTAILASALAILRPAQREVVCLRYVEQLTTAQVALVTNRTITGVKAMQWRALGALRRHLAGYDL